MADLTLLLDESVGELLKRLAVVAGEIGQASRRLAAAKGEELEDRSSGWHQSIEDTVRGREKASQFNATASIRSKYETEAELDELRAERDFLVILIDVRTKAGVLSVG